MATTLTPILTKFWDHPQSWTLETYEANEGYQALTKALAMDQSSLVSMAKDSGLRGRGGAGFPTGMKWSFLPPPDGGPRYLVVNADESEPGTCKDIPLMMAAPHFLIEGVAITSYAIGCNHAFIYLRGEVVHVYRRLLRAVEEAYAAGHLGKNILGSGFDLDVTVHAGAGAYICGEETALLDSLEGRAASRAQAAVPGRGRPLCPSRRSSTTSSRSLQVPPDPAARGRLVRGDGHRESKGFGIFSLSGHVTRPASTRRRYGITLRELLEMAGGMRGGKKLKFWTPGGSSTPLFTEEHLDIPLDFDSVAKAGSMLGTRALQIFDETTCVVRAVDALDSTSTSTSPAASAPRAARARGGSSRSWGGWSTARATRRTSRSCSTSATTSSGARSARWVTARPRRSPAAFSTSVRSSLSTSARAGVRSIATPPLSSRRRPRPYDRHP
jgi:NADH-quinone oxidoreductase subunit F